MPLQTAQHSVVEFNSAEPSLIDFPVDEDSSLLLPPPPLAPPNLFISCVLSPRSPLFSARRSDAPSSFLHLPHRPTASRRQQITSSALSLACAKQRVTGHDDKRSLGTKPNHTVRYYNFRNENRISCATTCFKNRHPKTNGLMLSKRSAERAVIAASDNVPVVPHRYSPPGLNPPPAGPLLHVLPHVSYNGAQIASKRGLMPARGVRCCKNPV